MFYEKLIPLIFKLQDSDDETLKSLVEILEDEFDTVESYISGLSELMRPDPKFYDYIYDYLGGKKFDQLELNSWLVKNIIFLHKIKGTNQSWQKYWMWISGRSDLSVVELYKTTLNETERWSGVKDSTYGLKSSKIEICSMSCETYFETDDIDPREYFEMVSDVAPVHVRLRPDVESTEIDENFTTPDDTLGCRNCETICETVCETETEDWTGSNVEGTFSDSFPQVYDTIDIISRCVHTCETSCESCCETACQCNPCELFCETGCETNRQYGDGGELTCSTICQVQCETLCMFKCETACQSFECEANTCQHACTGACQGKCETLCTSISCENVCAGVVVCMAGKCQCGHF